MKKWIDNFICTDNEGCEYTINIYTDIIDTGNLNDPSRVIEGLKELETSDGKPVNRLKQGEYEIIETSVILHSNSPKAP
ncbi:MAG: hypothetical protein HQ541_04190 [Mariniphaga sp.]|nr:hypothetical protein [Mariniphaga sp.]